MRKKYGSARRVADSIIRRMRFACSITKNTETSPEYCNILYIAAEIVVKRTRPSVMLKVHCVSYLFCRQLV